MDEFALLESKIEEMLSDVCTDLGCRESMTGNGQDYIGCQYQTVSGYMCQNWLEQSPQSHSYIPEWYPDGHLGDHNFCRNPDGDSTIWSIFAFQLNRFLAHEIMISELQKLMARIWFNWTWCFAFAWVSYPSIVLTEICHGVRP